jgi:hypothetical protein
VGDDHDLGELAAHLAGTVTISRAEPEGWELATDRFQRLADAGAIRKAALELVVTLNGLAAVRIDGASPITIGNVRRYRADGAKDAWAFPEPIAIRFRAFAPTVLVNGGARTPTPWGPDLELADRGEAVRAVLAFLAIHPASWHSLAAALDVILKDSRTNRRDGVRAWGKVSDGQIRRFTSTANSWAVLGAQARHGPSKQTAPSNPMTLGDAVAFVRGVAALWLEELVRRGA